MTLVDNLSIKFGNHCTCANEIASIFYHENVSDLHILLLSEREKCFLGNLML